MYQFVRLTTVLLTVSVIGCWSQHRKSLTSVSGKSHLQPLVDNSSSTVEFKRNNVQHSPDSATSINEIHLKQLPIQPLLSYNFEKIEFGMQRGEVEKLLGGPPGHYGRNLGTPTMTAEGGPPSAQIWTDDTNMLEVAFDKNDTVICTHERAGYSRSP